ALTSCVGFIVGMSPTDPTTTPASSVAVEQLPDDPPALKALIAELLASLQEARRESEQLSHRLDGLLRRLYGPRAERWDPSQPPLFADPPDDNTPAAAP